MQKIKDSAKALEHVRRELSQGATLAKSVMSRTDFTPGDYFAGIPENVDQSQLDFRSCIPGLSGEPMVFAKVIRSFIRNPDSVALVEDIDPFSDPFPAEEDSSYRRRAMTYNDEVYWNLSGLDLTEKDILELLNQPFPYPSSVFFSVARTVAQKPQLKDSDLQLILENLVGVAVRAFDGDSFLIWWREDLRPFPAVFAKSGAVSP